MNASVWIPAVIGTFTLLFLVTSALLGVLIRVTSKATKTEDKLNELAEDIKELIAAKDNVHAKILDQMKYDRDTTDKRLRYMEEWFMRKGLQT